MVRGSHSVIACPSTYRPCGQTNHARSAPHGFPQLTCTLRARGAYLVFSRLGLVLSLAAATIALRAGRTIPVCCPRDTSSSWQGYHPWSACSARRREGSPPSTLPSFDFCCP